MATLSREEARILIGRIREDNGGISPEDRAASRPAVLRALENVRRKLGAATKTYIFPGFIVNILPLEAIPADFSLKACYQSLFYRCTIRV
jgi:hypothetical protein